MDCAIYTIHIIIILTTVHSVFISFDRCVVPLQVKLLYIVHSCLRNFVDERWNSQHLKLACVTNCIHNMHSFLQHLMFVGQEQSQMICLVQMIRCGDALMHTLSTNVKSLSEDRPVCQLLPPLSLLLWALIPADHMLVCLMGLHALL